MFCQQCGATVDPNVLFCPACGHQQTVLPGNVPPPLPQGGAMLQPIPFIPPVAVRANTGQWINRAWEYVKTDIGLFAGMTILHAIVGSVGSFITQGPMQCGFHIACMKKIIRGRTEIGDLFLGFNFFVPALVAALLTAVFCFAGFLLCIIPGLVVAAMYQFTYLFIVDRRMDFWPAMQASHAVVKNDYFGFVLFLLALGLLNIVGFLCLLVGLLITIPVSIMAVTIAYQEL